MEGDSIPAIRPLVGVVDWYRSVAARLDTTLLKRVAVATYFGVYAAIAFGGRRVLNEAGGSLPAVVRPPRLAPLHVVFDLPRSVAWALVSFTAMLLVVGVLVAVSLYRDDRESADRPPRLGRTSFAGELRVTAGGRAVRRRVRAVGRRIRGALPDGRPSFGSDRPSPSTDGGATVGPEASEATTDPETSGVARSADGDDDRPADEDDHGPAGDDAGTDSAGEASAEEKPAVDPLNPFGGNVPVDPPDAFDDAEVLTADPSDSPDESVPGPDEEEDGADGGEDSARAEWPGDWIAGDEV